MKRVIVALDMGGTNIKAGTFDACSRKLLKTVTVPVNSSGTICEYRQTLNDIRGILLNDCCVCAVQVSTPGPFDYAKGVSRMTHKYQAIYGLDLRSIIRDCLGASDKTAVEFLSDANACLLGEYVAGEAYGQGNTAVVTLGTGLGFAIMEEGRLLVNETGRPYYISSILPYEDGNIENFVSGTGLSKEYYKRTGIQQNAKEIAESCMPEAIKLYSDMGMVLGRAVKEILERHNCHLLLVGGQVAASGNLFIPLIQKELGNIEVKCVRGITDSALIGAVAAYQNMDIYHVYIPQKEN